MPDIDACLMIICPLCKLLPIFNLWKDNGKNELNFNNIVGSLNLTSSSLSHQCISDALADKCEMNGSVR